MIYGSKKHDYELEELNVQNTELHYIKYKQQHYNLALI